MRTRPSASPRSTQRFVSRLSKTSENHAFQFFPDSIRCELYQARGFKWSRPGIDALRLVTAHAHKLRSQMYLTFSGGADEARIGGTVNCDGGYVQSRGDVAQSSIQTHRTGCGVNDRRLLRD